MIRSHQLARSFLFPFQQRYSGNSTLLLSHLKSATNDDVVAFQKLLGKENVVTSNKDDDLLEKFNHDWTGRFIGKSNVVLKPSNVEEVASIVEYCQRERIGIVPQGGNTGLVGGSTPIQDEVIMSLSKLDGIDSFHDGVLTCGAGCILEHLQHHVEKHQHKLPIDLGAKGSCMIGGNISTNAGGSYFYRYGSIHANVLGLEVVLASGEILDLMNSNQKDNTGYDMKHLFIGAEGTLGIVTKVALNCPPLPTSRHAALVACESYDDVYQIMMLAKKILGETLAALEFMDPQILQLLQKHNHVLPFTLTEDGQFGILIESLGSNESHDAEKMDTFLNECMERGHIMDGVMAQDLTQVQEMWSLRESCNPVTKAEGYNYKYDVSLPISEYYAFVEEMRQHLYQTRPDVKNVNWGHVMDGNLHFNVITAEKDDEVEQLLEPYIFQEVYRRKGSISAEHGLGRCKNQYLGIYAKNKISVGYMKSLKQLFDPHNILNPHKYLPN